MQRPDALPLIRARLQGGRRFASSWGGGAGWLAGLDMVMLADRFLRLEGVVTIDLASGEEVSITVTDGGPLAEQHAWAARCATVYGCRHPHLVELVDFGSLGKGERFEAYRIAARAPRWRRRDAATAGALRSAVGFLHARGLSAGSLAWDRVMDRRGQPMLVPDAGTGAPNEESRAADAGADLARGERETLEQMLKRCDRGERIRVRPGTVFQPPALVEQVVEWLEAAGIGTAGCLHLVAPPKAGVAAMLGTIAREARLRGFVPVARECLTAGFRSATEIANLHELLRTRHVLVLDDRTPLRQADTETARADLSRALLALGATPTRSVFAVVAAPVGDRGDLRGVWDLSSPDGWRPTVPDGSMNPVLPARLNGEGCAGQGRPDRCASIGVRESRPRYGARLRDAARTRLASCTSTSDLHAHKLFNEGRRLAGLGRHAPAERTLRAAMAALARRDECAAAGFSAVHLGSLLLERGRAPAALEAFQAAREHFLRLEATAAATCAAIYIGLAQTDQGRLADGEATLRAAAVAARNVGDGAMVRFARAGLGRCLLWQARYQEARTLLEGDAEESEDTSNAAQDNLPNAAFLQDVRLGCVSARVALAMEDLLEAGRRAQAALDHGRHRRDPGALAVAHTALAGLHARVGDIDALRLHVSHGLAAARTAHAPLGALRLRLTLVEGLLGAGRDREAQSHVRPLASARRIKLPELLRRRVEATLAAASDRGAARPNGRPQFVREAAHAAIADGEHEAPHRPGRRPIDRLDVEEITEVLHVCHEIEDEQEALSRVALIVRRRTGAMAAGFFGWEADTTIPLISVGSLQPQAARRAIESGLAILPERSATGTEAAAPVRFAGTTTGAVACRWGVVGPVDPARAGTLLMTAAAACAPLVRILLDRRRAAPVVARSDDFDLLGASSAIAEVRRAIARASSAPFPVLIEGESGSGKELIAKAVHRAGARRERKFCPLNCAALSDELIEAELFGHARGAFTGAIAERAGLFEEADGGTIFLDEVSELSPRAQAKLLRVIQEGEIRRIGENFARPIDARVIAATNRSLQGEAAAGRFRTDLLYRLDVIRIAVPPLRERIDDVPALAVSFWRQATERIGSRAVLGQATLAALARYDWPGNVRELQNVLAALAVCAPRRGIAGPGALPAALAQLSRPQERLSLEEARRLFEQRFVKAALARAGGHRGRAAASVGVSRQGFAKLMQRLGLDGRPVTGEPDTRA